jgi:hypothetical protein
MTAPVAPPRPPVLAVPLRSRRRDRGLLLQKLEHAIPAVALLHEGLRGLLHHEQGFALALAVGEVASSLLLIAAFTRRLREHWRASRAPHPQEAHSASRFDWLEIFTAAVLVVEALEHQHRTGHLPRPTLLLAAVLLVLGLCHSWIHASAARRLVLRVDERGVAARLSRLRRFSIAWQDLAAVEIGERKATFVTRSGRRKGLDLADLHDAHEVRQALLAVREHLAKLHPPAPAPGA